MRGGKVISTYPIDFDGQCISAHPQEQDIAVGGGVCLQFITEFMYF